MVGILIMKANTISIVIPTWNEEGNIPALINRIDMVMKRANFQYEIVFVDDKSTDKTTTIIQKAAKKYPITLFTKKGRQGKAQSLLEGFAVTKYPLICMIDADLQYPPESIPEMVKKIAEGADVVVSNRQALHTSIERRILSRGFFLIFGKFLHGFHCDVQSGLKVFKKEILERITLKPSAWTFDLHFLIQARDAGYMIETVDIVFHQRQSGDAKIGLLKASYEIGLSALKLKFAAPEIIPFHPDDQKKKGKGFHFRSGAYVPHNELHHSETALYTVTPMQKLVGLGFFIILAELFLLDWHTTLVGIIATLTSLYFIDLLFSFFLVYRSFSKSPEIKISEEEIKAVPESAWPKYTIFCPLYKEWEVLPQFVTAMSRLDYPVNKLQIMLLLEEDDQETIEHARAYNLPRNFEIVVVPHSKPKTKPKAMNYGLKYTKGEFVTIYDAEDVPDPLQLKKAVLAFKQAGERVVCIQAKLNFYNPHQNILTRAFTAEYSLWFDLILTGLQSMQAPIPLGGTSNHFRKSSLLALKGWDSFNVTEDCDLGMRLVKNGYRTAIVESTTYEEANSDNINWFWQRTRWIKGYIQTYLVHMRNPKSFFQTSRRSDHIGKSPMRRGLSKITRESFSFFAFQIIVGEKIFSMFINPLMWLITITYFVFRPSLGIFIESFFPAPVLYMGVICLIFGNFIYMYNYMIGCAKRGYEDLIKFTFLIPLYWIAMSFAAWVALYKLIKQPHFWAKTKHGLYLQNTKAVAQAKQTIGNNLVDTDMTDYTVAPVRSINVTV